MTTPAQYDAAITALMATGMSGENYKVILASLQDARAKAIKNTNA